MLFYWKYLLASLMAGDDTIITQVASRRHTICNAVRVFVGLRIYWLQNVAHVQLQNTCDTVRP